MRIRQQNKQAPGLTGVPYMALELKDNEEENNNTGKGRQLRTAALVVSWISVIFSFITGVAAIVLGQLQENESLFGYGLDAVLDSFSSVAVLWRFYGSISSTVAEGVCRHRHILLRLVLFINL
ncbi:unnamed protein product [Lymnaea stagnalis]|uniref:Transmembrane protein 163 n=1 Tax=Lymnaea stagnalis TaxID=6523 RepID=A0AAV2HYI3_LYMST